MSYSMINAKIIEIFVKCDIKSFPLNCEYIVKKLGCQLYKYSELPEEKRKSCLLVSDESMKLYNRIYYNDCNMSEGRARFSIMHELGHIVLNHGDYRNDALEAEANYFASTILAPRIAMHYAKCTRPKHVIRLFGLTYEAATYALEDYNRWYLRASRKMDQFDRAMYSHFYNPESEKFVYSIKKCQLCGETLLNDTGCYCSSCYDRVSPGIYDVYEDKGLRVAESQWLYEIR